MVRQLLLLGILQEGKMHGYQLNEYISHTMGSYTDLKKPTAYYTLEKLEKDGYIQKELERQGKRPERHVYEITEKGRSCFVELLREHLRSYTRTYYADDVGIAFIDLLPTDEARQLLAEKRDKVRTLLNQFREHPKVGKNWRHVANHNIVHLEADLTWLNGVIDELDYVRT